MSKNKRPGRRQVVKTLADFTINDCANATVCNNRIKKSGNLILDNNPNTEECELNKKLAVKKWQKDTNIDNNNEHRKDYPIDIWFLISEFITPELVGIFAAICKTSLQVVLSDKFWRFMYKKYYKNNTNLPSQLELQNLRSYGLRTLVIRSLFYFYTPFIERLIIETNKKHPSILKNKKCVSYWHIGQGKKWIYYFKFKMNNPVSFYRNINKSDMIEVLNDIFANTEEDCCILKVSGTEFTSIVPILGQTLTSVSLNLAKGFGHYRLQLQFGNHLDRYCSPRGGVAGINVIIDPVKEAKVLDWWHPLYPHTRTV